MPKVWKQFRDTEFWLSDEGDVEHRYKNGKRRAIVPFRTHSTPYRIRIKDKKYILSRILWETFYGEIPEGKYVTHKNGCSSMNDIYNLMLINVKDNCRKAAMHNRKKVINLYNGEVYDSITQAAQRNYYSRPCVSKLAKKREGFAIIEREKDDEDIN